MSDQITVDVSADPQVMLEIEKMKGLVENADTSHVIRAAVRYFAESSAEYEREVYIREQLELESEGVPGAETSSEDSTSDIQANYSEEEWHQLAGAVILAPFNMTVNVGKSGVTKTIRESAALANGARKLSMTKYKNNRLIGALLAGKDLQKSISHESPIYDDALAKIKAAAEIVDQRESSEEAQGYKNFLIDLTQHVAEAAGEGFMGRGEKVSQAEIDYINTLKNALGISSD